MPEPATTDRNVLREQASQKAREAIAKEAALTSASVKAQKNPDRVYFVSAAEESTCYELRVRNERYQGYWDDQRKHVCWDMPKEHAELFKEQYLFTTGRIIEAK